MSDTPAHTPSILYHYAPMTAVQAILTNGCIWLSDATCMNDALEGVWLDEMVKLLFQAREKWPWLESGHMFSDYKICKKTFYIACFSEVGDLLSQWRAYADDGRGASIGFNFDDSGLPVGLTFTQVFHMKALGCTIDRVIYAEQEQLEALRRVFSYADKMLRILKHPYAYDGVIDTGRDCLSYASRLLKHAGFSEEREWRIVYDGQADRASGIEREQKRRVRGQTEVAYFQLNFRNRLHVREVVLGPKCALSIDEATLFLERAGYREFTVQRSNVPYR